MEPRCLKLEAGGVEVEAALNDTSVADAAWDALPLRSDCSTWGDEIYFRVGLNAGEDGPQEVVEMGDVAYWAPGDALCVFFGPTPASRGDEIRPASPVTVIGRVVGDPKVLKAVAPGDAVEVRRA